MGYIIGEDRNQAVLMPEYIDDYITADNTVRIIDVYVNGVSIEKLGFKYSKTKATGRPPYDPKDMLKLYMYGYFNRIRSSRRLETECKRNIELMWLLSKLAPDHKTISNFRKDNKNALEGVFRQVTLLCSELGLHGKELIAVDGSKFRANNSRRKNYSKNKIERHLKYIDERIKEFMTEMEKNDENEKESGIKLSIEELQTRIKELESRKEKYTELEQRIKQEGEISLTDPDSRMMKCGNNNGTEVSHNVQISVDSKHSLVVDFDVTSSPADQGQLYKISRRTKRILGAKTLKVLADKGYYTTKCLVKCSHNNLETYVARPGHSSPTGDISYSKDKFIYDPQRDIYICPETKELSYRRTRECGGILYREYLNKEACRKCQNRDNCTKNKLGRTISRNEHQELLDEVDKRTSENKSLYRQRQMIVEHPFGTIKRGFGYSYFLLRGKEGVRAESALHFLTYNLKRVINIMGFGKLMSKLASRISNILFLVYHFLEYYCFMPRYLELQAKETA